MDLDECEQMDGTKVSFDRRKAALVAPHPEGGTTVILEIGSLHRELHLKGGYEDLKKQLAETTNERVWRDFNAEDAAL